MVRRPSHAGDAVAGVHVDHLSGDAARQRAGQGAEEADGERLGAIDRRLAGGWCGAGGGRSQRPAPTRPVPGGAGIAAGGEPVRSWRSLSSKLVGRTSESMVLSALTSPRPSSSPSVRLLALMRLAQAGRQRCAAVPHLHPELRARRRNRRAQAQPPRLSSSGGGAGTAA